MRDHDIGGPGVKVVVDVIDEDYLGTVEVPLLEHLIDNDFHYDAGFRIPGPDAWDLAHMLRNNDVDPELLANFTGFQMVWHYHGNEDSNSALTQLWISDAFSVMRQIDESFFTSPELGQE